MKRKMMSLLLCLAMLISFGSFTALAADDVTLSFETVSTSVAAEGTVSMTIKLSNPNGKAINGAAVQLSVPSNMTYVSSKLGGNFLFENYSSTGLLSCTVSGEGTVDADGNTSANLAECGKGVTAKEITLATVTYKVAKGVAAGTQLKVTASLTELFDADVKDISHNSAFTKTFTVNNQLPTPLISSVGTSVKGVEVKWNAVPNAQNYGVWYKTATGAWTKAGNTTSTTYVVTGLTSGTTYTFTVRCLSADGSTYTSGFDSVGKTFTYLATPTVSSVSSGSNGVTVDWGAVSGATKYRVFYKVAGGSWTKAADVTGTSYTVTGLTAGKTYTFTVRCIDSAGNYTSGFDSTGKTITYTTSSKLATPKLTYIGTSVKGVEVKWDAVPGAVNYGVWYKTATGSWTKFGNTTGTSVVVSGLTSGTTYTFTVRCLSADGKSYTSDFDSVGKTFMYLATPELTYIGTSVKGVEVKWNAVKNAENYGVWYKTATGSWTKAGNTTGTTYVVSGLTSGTTYTFTVRCLSADGKTYMSGFDSVGKTFMYLATPVIASVGTSVKGVEVKWNAVKNAENYGVWYKTATGSWTKAGNTTGTTYVVTGLTSGTTYTFTVRCLSADGKTYMSGFDSVGKQFTFLTTPTVSAATKTTDGVKVEWAPVAGAYGYRVFYKVSGGSWVKAADVTGVSSSTVTGLTAGKTYTFTVRCIDSAGNYTSGFDSTGKTLAY
ncbi:MAG: fibronectin type III domain-containing protein [Oscillospiraceae bacterium]|nr:fibronectin type III domain-containing protein [Oscillospiraceae bacterium]